MDRTKTSWAVFTTEHNSSLKVGICPLVFKKLNCSQKGEYTEWDSGRLLLMSPHEGLVISPPWSLCSGNSSPLSLYPALLPWHLLQSATWATLSTHTFLCFWNILHKAAQITVQVFDNFSKLRISRSFILDSHHLPECLPLSCGKFISLLWLPKQTPKKSRYLKTGMAPCLENISKARFFWKLHGKCTCVSAGFCWHSKACGSQPSKLGFCEHVAFASDS